MFAGEDAGGHDDEHEEEDEPAEAGEERGEDDGADGGESGVARGHGLEVEDSGPGVKGFGAAITEFFGDGAPEPNEVHGAKRADEALGVHGGGARAGDEDLEGVCGEEDEERAYNPAPDAGALAGGEEQDDDADDEAEGHLAILLEGEHFAADIAWEGGEKVLCGKGDEEVGGHEGEGEDEPGGEERAHGVIGRPGDGVVENPHRPREGAVIVDACAEATAFHAGTGLHTARRDVAGRAVCSSVSPGFEGDCGGGSRRGSVCAGEPANV